MRDFFKHNKHVYLALYLPIYLAAFFLVESVVTTHYTPIYWPAVDDAVPFDYNWILIYLLWAPLMAATGVYLMLRDPDAFRRYMYRIMIGFTVSTIIFFAFPNGQDLRPLDFQGEGIFAHWVRLTYIVDTNTNVMPSVHVIGAVFMAQCYFDSPKLKKHRWLPPLAAIVAALICYATLAVKQHSALDVVAGLALCVPVWFIVDVYIAKKMRARASQG